MIALRRACIALLLVAVPAAAQADERITHFWSDVQIQKDASVEVTETIDVRAEHDRIDHGIFRDFPTRYQGPYGRQIHIEFTFEGATLDGMPVPASTSLITRGVRIKLGDPDKYVDVGDHRYVIRYRATRELGFFPNYDEIYWNVTGTGWVFPIDAAEVRIHLPSPVKFGQRAAYTGAEGSTATNAQVIDEKPGEIAWATTAPLGEYEGLTVAAAFPKGLVDESAAPTQLTQWLEDYGPPLVGAASLISLLAYFYYAWQRAGRNPRAGTVVPIFSPPDDLTPAGMRYVAKMGADNRTFAAALVDMGVRGHIRLVEEDGGWFSKKKTRIERMDGPNALPSDEQAALRELISTGDSIVMEQKNYKEFAAAKKGLESVLKDQFDGKAFKRNYGWAAAGLLFFFAALWATSAAVVAAADTTSIWQIGVTIGCLTLAAILAFLIHESTWLGKLVCGLIGFIAFAIAAVVGFPMFAEALNSGSALPVVIPALALPMVISCFWWIAAPTREGRGILDRIAGFKQYLSITERERLDRMTMPQDTPDVFEKYLPYAIALGVENKWANRFASVLAAAQARGDQPRGFYWYSGTGSPWNNPSLFVNTVGATLASTISSASTAPGSSSGSGGGGFSGGGGGGGGGGGW